MNRTEPFEYKCKSLYFAIPCLWSADRKWIATGVLSEVAIKNRFASLKRLNTVLAEAI